MNDIPRQLPLEPVQRQAEKTSRQYASCVAELALHQHQYVDGATACAIEARIAPTDIGRAARAGSKTFQAEVERAAPGAIHRR